MEEAYIVVFVNFVIAILVMGFLFLTLKHFKDLKYMRSIVLIFSAVSLVYVVYAAIEVLHLPEVYYAAAGLLTTILLCCAILIINKKARMWFG